MFENILAILSILAIIGFLLLITGKLESGSPLHTSFVVIWTMQLVVMLAKFLM